MAVVYIDSKQNESYARPSLPSFLGHNRRLYRAKPTTIACYQYNANTGMSNEKVIPSPSKLKTIEQVITNQNDS